MSPINQSRNKTAFTISIEAKRGITTGISAKDRSRTIKIASKKNANKNDIVSPGHIFPIIAKDGGVLVRAGHTEASVDISRLAKKNKLVASEYMEPTDDEGVYRETDSLGEGTLTDPKGVVVNPVRGSSTQYKVSRKGKIKKEV